MERAWPPRSSATREAVARDWAKHSRFLRSHCGSSRFGSRHLFRLAPAFSGGRAHLCLGAWPTLRRLARHGGGCGHSPFVDIRPLPYASHAFLPWSSNGLLLLLADDTVARVFTRLHARQGTTLRAPRRSPSACLGWDWASTLPGTSRRTNYSATAFASAHVLRQTRPRCGTFFCYLYSSARSFCRVLDCRRPSSTSSWSKARRRTSSASIQSSAPLLRLARVHR